MSPIIEPTPPPEPPAPERPDYVEVYRDSAKEYRWRRISGANHNILSDSGEGYKRRIDCAEVAESLNPGLVLSYLPDSGEPS